MNGNFEALNYQSKIIRTLSALRRTADILRSQGKVLVFTNGCFDIVHRGHVEFLTRAKLLGDVLIVGLNGDASVRKLKGDKRPFVNEADRAFMLSALACVDYVYIFNEPRCHYVIRAIRPDIYVKAKEYAFHTLDVGEKEALQECYARMVFLEPLKGYSTTDIVERIRRL